ncbi:MAG TPA: hypothetical protein VF243_00955, partial [Nitrosospira sp.]
MLVLVLFGAGPGYFTHRLGVLNSIRLIASALPRPLILRKGVIHARPQASEGQTTYKDFCCFHHLS